MFVNHFDAGTLNGWTPQTEGGPPIPPVLPGRYGHVCRFDVTAGQKRQELVSGGNGNPTYWQPQQFQSGDDIYFASAYWLAPGFPLTGSWQILHQWQTPAPTSQTAGTSLECGSWNTGQWLITACGWPGGGSSEAHSLGPVKAGVWTRFIVRIKFAAVPAASVVQVWRSDADAPLVQVFDSNAKQPETLNTVQSELRPGWWQSFAGETAGSQGGTFRAGCLGGFETHGVYRDPALANDAHLLSAGVGWASTLLDAAATI